MFLLSVITIITCCNFQNQDRKDVLEKMNQLEAQRQDVYVKLLKQRGQYVTLGGGGGKLISYPNLKVTFPNVLKKRSPANWTFTEKIWANLWVSKYEKSKNRNAFQDIWRYIFCFDSVYSNYDLRKNKLLTVC